MAVTFDDKKNFAYSAVGTAPSPATSGTSLVVGAGDGAKFPAVPFNATVWPAGTQPLTTNAEVIRVTAIATDTFTITRAQEGSSARSIISTDQIAATVTAKALEDVEAAFATVSAISTPIGGGMLWFSDTAPPDPWIMLRGQAISRTTYSALFALWGTTYGVGDNVSTFNVPDFQRRIPIGKAASGTVSTLGETQGSWDHTHGPGTLTVASHTHGPGTLTVISHTHGAGTLSVASHTHGAGTLTVASHTHSTGTYDTSNADLSHTHGMSHTHDMADHTHGYTNTTDEESGTISTEAGGGDLATGSHSHEVSGTTGGPSTNTTGAASSTDTGGMSANSTHNHSLSGVSGGTAPTVTSGTTGSTAPTVNAGVTGGTAPAVSAGVTEGTAPAVSAGVTAAGNPPVLVVNFIVRALSGV